MGLSLSTAASGGELSKKISRLQSQNQNFEKVSLFSLAPSQNVKHHHIGLYAKGG